VGPDSLPAAKPLLELLESLRPGSCEIILESDVVRFVAEREGRAFWREWWEAEEKKR